MHYPEIVHSLLIESLSMALAATALGWPIGSLHEAISPVGRLPQADRAIVTRLLRPTLGPLYQGEPPQLLDNAVQAFRSERVHLGRIPAIAVQASGDRLCSPAGNCLFWLIDLQHRRILLKAGEIQSFALDKSATGSLPDMVSSSQGSETQSDLIRWHYEGARYEGTECASVEYADANGNKYSEPKFTPHPCNEGNDSSR